MAGVYTVTQVTAYIKNMFLQDFALERISIEGEVSNCKYHTSGHIYFTLKDGGAQIAAVMFARERKGLTFRLEEGMQVVARGRVDVYERDGSYRLYVREAVRAGLGALYERFERLRSELEEMGMFDPCYKQPIPRYARTVGVVTAPTGAAIQDIINIARRRNPYVQLLLCPALVQGRQAKSSIAAAIRRLDALRPDVMIVGRGGGSIEDLWAFNEEEVARAIFDCRTPVISAVGHETDVTIADYVADLRAPTPSAAAELAVFDYREFEERLQLCDRALRHTVRLRIGRERARLKQLYTELRLYNPQRRIDERRQRLADLQQFLERRLTGCLQERRRRLERGRAALEGRMERALRESRHRLALAAGRLDGLSPLKKLGGGYGFIADGAGRALRSVRQTSAGETIVVSLPDGRLRACVEQVETSVRPSERGKKEEPPQGGRP